MTRIEVTEEPGAGEHTPGLAAGLRAELDDVLGQLAEELHRGPLSRQGPIPQRHLRLCPRYR